MDTNLSARIKDEHIQQTVKQNLKKKRGPWRWIWLAIVLALLGSLTYFGYRFTLYGKAKTADLVARGRQAAEQKNYSEALDDFNQALLFSFVAKERAAAAAFGAAKIEGLGGGAAAAQRHLRQAIDLQPSKIEYRVALVESLIDSANLREAQTVLSDIRNLDTVDANDKRVLFAQALLAIAQNKPQQAVTDLEKVVSGASATGPGTDYEARAQYLLAGLIVSENPERAIKMLDNLAVGAGPGVAGVEQSVATNAYQDLASVARQVESKINNDAYEQVLIGVSLLRGGEPYAALVSFKKALASDATYRDAWIYRASAEIDVQQLSAAADSVERAIKLDPTYGFSRFIEARLLTQKEQWQLAIQDYKQALDLGYQKIEVYLGLSRAQTSANAKAAAADTLKDSLKNEQIDHQLIYEELFWLYFEQEDFTRARQVAKDYAQAFANSDQPSGFAALALYFLNQKNEAENMSKDVLSSDPLNPVATLTQGLILRDESLIRHAVDLDLSGHLKDIAEKSLRDL